MDDNRQGPGRGQRSRGDSLPVGSAATTNGRAQPYRYTIADLERETGVKARNIRYYITQGLLPAANGRGVGATYGPDHLLRLKYITTLKDSNMPLAEIRQKLEGLQGDTLAAMLRVETAPPQDRWRRIHLHPDIELHVREPGSKERNVALEQAVQDIAGHAEIVLNKLEKGQ